MMNSYEIDQPLDLRLKALNLSLGSCQNQHHACGTSHTVHNMVVVGSCGSNSSGMSSIGSSHGCSGSSSSLASINSNFNCSIGHFPVNSNTNVSQESFHQQSLKSVSMQINQTPASTFINLAAHRAQPSPLMSRQNPHQQTQTQQQHQATSQSHLRSTNIHCQPLNHRQPHPLSRLHPAPSHVQQRQQSVSVPPPPPPPPLPSMPLSIQMAHQQHHNQQSSFPQHPPRQRLSPLNTSPLYQRPALPVRSMSVSGHLLAPISASSGQQQPVQLDGAHSSSPSSNGSSQASDTSPASQQQLAVGKLSNNSSTSSPNTVTFASQEHANKTNQAATSNSSTSPIMRQHSLVSRYNCKPCGIVFSQPETLRAHQEGYCTKRDRIQQTQVRSQSAVSPSVTQQTIAPNDSNK